MANDKMKIIGKAPVMHNSLFRLHKVPLGFSLSGIKQVIYASTPGGLLGSNVNNNKSKPETVEGNKLSLEVFELVLMKVKVVFVKSSVRVHYLSV